MNSHEMAAAIPSESVFGDTPIEQRQCGVSLPPGLNFGTQDSPGGRPGSDRNSTFHGNVDAADAFLAQSEGDTNEVTRTIRCNLLRARAVVLFNAKRYAKAHEAYIEAAVAMVGVPLPVKDGFISDAYIGLGYHWKPLDVMACCNGAAACMIKLKDYEGALEWLEEIEVLYKNSQFSATSDNPSFDWFDFNINVSDQYFQRLTALAAAADIFLELGNTGTAVQRRWLGSVMSHRIPPPLNNPAMQSILPKEKMEEIQQLRHPDPKLVPKLDLKDERLQVRGSWKKVELKKGGGVTSRMGVACFVHKGHLYILGGEKFLEGPWYREFWMLDLTKLDEWRPLPSYPIPLSVIDNLVGYSMAVHSDEKAYLFTGRRQIDFFDLATRKWGHIMTTYKGDDGRVKPGRWPYPGNRVVDYAMQCVDGRLYVFGGTHADSIIGCNLFLELNLQTKEWRRLSGSITPDKADYSCPGPRRHPISWVGKDKTKIFLMYGDADRQGAMISGEKHGSVHAYAYDDLWSWDIKTGKWNREKLNGNLPCQRSEMSCTYNSNLDKVIVFGGYSPSVPTFYAVKNELFHFSYYADTFIYGTDTPTTPPSSNCSSSPKWKQVLTRGFPTYRAQAKLISDPTTGKTFLFGGYTNTEFVPSRSQYVSRSFADLWQLRMDVPGGFFEGVDLEEEARTAKAGPWQRCFTCGSAGPWKKCGGTCNGRAFFCNHQCLKEGWKEHKLKHTCHKTT